METSKSLIRESVRILSYLYSVVVALALTTAVRALISQNGIRSPFNLPLIDLFMFSTFLVTLLPFYHGAVMFLIKTYRVGFKGRKKGELLVDFVFLLFEAIILYALAASLFDLFSFIGWLAILMFLDSSWVFFVYFKTPRGGSEAPIIWGALNVFMLLFLYLLWNYAIPGEELSYAALLIGAIVRTILDYGFAYDYYFPSSEPAAY
jgi:hypothetical protein